MLTGDDADLTALPVHLGHGADGGPYISSSIDFVVDPKTGWTNVGVRRLMLRGRRETGIDLVSPSDLRAIYEASAASRQAAAGELRGRRPSDRSRRRGHAAADRRARAGRFAARCPLPVVKCVTNDIRVPADAEWVLEGYLDARGHVEPEGPYGEFLGYYGAVKRNPGVPPHRDHAPARRPVPDLDHRRLRRSRAPTPRCSTRCAPRSMIWRALETAVREPVAVHATASSGGMFNLRVALRQRVPGEARNAIAACFGALVNVKNVFVVDPDIDIFSDEQMDWALGTRFQPDRDLMVVEGMRTLPLDPSLAAAAPAPRRASI